MFNKMGLKKPGTPHDLEVWLQGSRDKSHGTGPPYPAPRGSPMGIHYPNKGKVYDIVMGSRRTDVGNSALGSTNDNRGVTFKVEAGHGGNLGLFDHAT